MGLKALSIFDFISVVAVAIISAFGGFLSAKTPRAGSREVAFIAVLQEEQAFLRKDFKTMTDEINYLYRKIRMQGEYIAELRTHIIQQLPPPPPPFPENMFVKHKEVDE